MESFASVLNNVHPTLLLAHRPDNQKARIQNQFPDFPTNHWVPFHVPTGM